MDADSINEIRQILKQKANPQFAEFSKKYLKSPYEFYGVKVPELRKIAKNYKNLTLNEIYSLFDELWNSGNHEEMAVAICMLSGKEKQFDIYTWKFIFSKLKDIKTWDHCDAISSWIIGKMLEKDISLKQDIENLALSKNPWFRRTSIVSTYQLIKKKKLELTFKLTEKLVYDEDIYVQKAAGWMLRECGKKDRMALRNFILMHLDMKAVAFSYATEKMKELRGIRKEKTKEKKEKLKE